MDIPRDWSFETTDIATAFDRHVREQLPWYDLATGAITHLIRHYLPKHGIIYDIGAATGNIGRAISEVVSARGARLVPIEVSKEMAAVYDGPGKDSIIIDDASNVEFEAFDVAILFLTLMFIVPGARKLLLERLVERTRQGGAIIILDKVVPRGGYLSIALARMTIAGKVAAGVPAEEIIAKELSLSGIQRPIEEDLIRGKEWFRFGEFVGWVVEK